MKKIVLFLALGMSLAFAVDNCDNEEFMYEGALAKGPDSGFCQGKSFEQCLMILKNIVDECYRKQMLENNRQMLENQMLENNRR